jgi:hypothetical protein
VPAEYVSATASRQIPDTDSPIGGSTHERVLGGSECPDAALVSRKGTKEKTCDWGVDMNGMIVGCRDDAAPRQEEAGHDRATVGRECEVFRFGIVDPSCAGKISRLEKYFVRVGER